MTTATGPSRPDTKKPGTAHGDIGDSDDRCTQTVFTITGAATRGPMAILDPTVVHAAPPTFTSDDEGDPRSKAAEPGPRWSRRPGCPSLLPGSGDRPRTPVTRSPRRPHAV